MYSQSKLKNIIHKSVINSKTLKKKIPACQDEILRPTQQSSGIAVNQNDQSEMSHLRLLPFLVYQICLIPWKNQSDSIKIDVRSKELESLLN